MQKLKPIVLLIAIVLLGLACVRGKSSPPVGTVDAGPEAQQLAQAYSPVLYLAKQDTDCDATIDTDPYDPAPVDLVLDKPDVRLMNNRGFPRSDSVDMTQPGAADLYEAGGKKYLDALERSHPRNADDRCDYETAYRRDRGARPAVYARVVHHDDSTAVQYWFFYSFDDWINRHEGDWELVQLLFPSGSAGDILTQSTLPEVMSFSQHSGGQRLDWSEVETLQVAGTAHPAVYVGAGSHANYPHPGYWHANVKYWFDGCDLAVEATAARRLDPMDYDLPLLSDPESQDHEFAWTRFPGNWGELSFFGFSGPGGPLHQTQGRDPWKWNDSLAEGANERCVQREGGQRSASAGSRILEDGGTFTQDVLITAGDVALFFITWGGSDVSLTLKNPAGVTIDVDKNDANLTHDKGDHKKGETYEAYRIVDADPGTWSMIIEGTDLPDPETVTWEAYDLPPTCDYAMAHPSDDSDLDGIPNSQEAAPETDPCSWDTDGDGTRDNGAPTPGAANPGDASSPSHKIGEPSGDPVVVITWSPLRGTQAFSIDWTQDGQEVPDTEADLPGDATDVRSPELPNGQWYFHLRTQGENGDWADTLHLGPFVIDQSTDCPLLQDLSLSTEADNNNVITVTWDSTGGCEPFEGTLTATYEGDQEPYAQYLITGPSGRMENSPPVRCEGTYDVTYSLTLADGAGQNLEATTSAEVIWLC